MQVTITQNDVINLKKFMLLHSKKAKRGRIISTYAVPFEFILVGIILDGLLKMVPILSLASLVLAILWLIIYPKFYKKMLKKHLTLAQNADESSILMNFEVNGEKITFYNCENPKPSEIFSTQNLDRVAKSVDNLFLGFKDGTHIVLPLNGESKAEVMKLNINEKDFEKVEL